jgi:hypothetical protein
LETIVLLVEDSKLQRLKNELILHRAGIQFCAQPTARKPCGSLTKPIPI